MNILKKMGIDQRIYNFKFHGWDDGITNYDMQGLLENIDMIRTYYESKDGSIETIDDFIDFLFLRKYTFFVEIKEKVKKEYVDLCDQAFKMVSGFFEKYKVKNVVGFLNRNGIEILKTYRYNIVSCVFDLSFKYASSCRDVLIFIVKNKFYLIALNFDDIKRILGKDKELSLEILDVKHFFEVKNYLLKNYFKMVKHYISRGLYCDEINEIIDAVLLYANEIENGINQENVIYSEIVYQQICGFLKDIKHFAYAVVENKSHQIEQKLQEYLAEYGQAIGIEIPFDKIMEAFKDDKVSLQQKILRLTHLNNEKNEVVSYFTFIAQDNVEPLTNSLSTIIMYDDYLTVTRQHKLDMFDYVYLTCLKYFVCKERITEFISILSSSTKIICDKYGLSFEVLDFETDYNILLNMYMELFLAYDGNNEFLIKGLNYSISMFIMALTEKILRNLYEEINNDKYIESEGLSLGYLLNKDNTITKLLGVDNVKIISYYLIKYDGKFGFNYRNNFAHYKNGLFDDVNYYVVLKTTQILLCIINELIINADNPKK